MIKRSRVRSVLDGALLLVALVFAVRWILNPQGPFEPSLALCSVLLAAIDYWYRSRVVLPSALPQTTPFPSPVDEEQLPNKGVVESELPLFIHSSSTDFFADRFAAAFPGLRSIGWFRSREAIERLAVLLANPLHFRAPDGGYRHPIWWFGRGNLQIEHFTRLDANTVLLDIYELRIGNIAAVYSSHYKALFVYLQAEAMEPTGLYESTSEERERRIREHGYASEEYGLFRKTHKVTREEYDDGSTRVMGKLVRMGYDVELRVRYITTYNMLLAAHDSPINNTSFDAELGSWLNRLLSDRSSFPSFVERVNHLPPRRIA
jgi:hypothetical protein